MDNNASSDDDEITQFFDAEDDVIIEQEKDFKRWDFDVWISSPQTIGERRKKFMRWIEQRLSSEFDGEDLPFNSTTNDDIDRNSASMAADVSRASEISEAVLRNSTVEDEFSSFSSRDFHNFDSSLNRGDISLVATKSKKPKIRRFSILRPLACVMMAEDDNLSTKESPKRARRVRVHRSRGRRSRELSALFTGQDIKAHEGSILAMKFSPEGRFLASAGEDKVVRVWKVLEEDRSAGDIPEVDPSCVCFSIGQRGPDSGPLTLEEMKKLNNRKDRDSACVVLPRKVFRILERPLHVFEGHNGEILDISWSNNDCLLSSSTDGTVRLWRVGVDECVKVFLHTDYVTCVQFNPTDDDYFVSGSIDGKLRLWNVSSRQVVDWLETRDMISALSYRPDGRGGVIGTIKGTCHFFDLLGNSFRLGAEICLTNKKKSPCKRITGFQFSPQDPTKLLVSSADSQVRLIHGTKVAQKYKGPTRSTNASNFTCASFTLDGEHVVSACEDSNVYLWNHRDEQSSSGPKKITNESFERFQSEDISMAIPWPGFEARPEDKPFPLCLDPLMGPRPKMSATWPEEKLLRRRPSAGGHLWGLVIIAAYCSGRIRSFHSYGLPTTS